MTKPKRPVEYCRKFINDHILTGGKTRKEYIHAMLEMGINRSTADYTWHQIFHPGGKPKNETNEHKDES